MTERIADVDGGGSKGSRGLWGVGVALVALLCIFAGYRMFSSVLGGALESAHVCTKAPKASWRHKGAGVGLGGESKEADEVESFGGGGFAGLGPWGQDGGVPNIETADRGRDELDRRVYGLDIEALEEYMARERPNQSELDKVDGPFRSALQARGIEEDPAIRCRGKICRAELRFQSLDDFRRIAGLRLGDGSEFYVKHWKEEGEYVLQVFRMQAGETFSGALGQGPHGG